MSIIISKSTATLAVIFIAVSQPALADALVASVSDPYIELKLQKCNEQLIDWQNKWAIAMGLAFFVFVLGTVSATVQGFKWQAVKTVTVICGLLITITTGFINLMEWDYHILKKPLAKGQLIVRKMNDAKDEFYLVAKTDDAKKVILADFGKLVLDFTALQESQSNTDTESDNSKGLQNTIKKADNFGYSIINSAYAVEGSPSWVSTVPEDSKYLYFVGVADSTNLGDAKTTSKDDAIKNATSFIATSLNAKSDKLDIDKLALSLAESSEDVDKYISFDEKNGTYRYYSLIRINKSVAEEQVNLFAVLRGIVAPPALIKALGDSQRVRDDYAAQQLEQTEALLNKTSAMLSEDEYRNFSEARELRKKKKDYEKVIAILEEILAKKPEFYLGWYNLALAYDASGNEEGARKAYDNSIALESAQQLQDGTVYNAYGHFLLERKQYCEAIPQLEKAVKLNEKNPRAQNNLKQVKSRLKEAGTVCH